MEDTSPSFGSTSLFPPKENFRVSKETTEKITITITCKALWENYVNNWKDIMFDEYLPGFFSSLKEVAEVLLSGDDLDYCAVQKLFRDGHTTMLLDEAMTYIDRPNTLREIVITGGKKPITITHEFIRF